MLASYLLLGRKGLGVLSRGHGSGVLPLLALGHWQVVEGLGAAIAVVGVVQVAILNGDVAAHALDAL